MAATAEKPPSLEGTIIRNRWRLESTLGKGSFGEVYLAFDSETCSRVAVKIEFPTVKKAVLKLEIAILKRLSFCKHICSFIAGGRFIAPHLLTKGQDPNDFVHTYLVMSLLGSSISDLRKKRQNGSFSIPTTCLLGIQMLTAIQAVHSTGVLHRDIKPGNFCIARECIDGNPRPLCHLIDFGLSRRYLNSSGTIREERSNVGFRGTARYASIAAHCGKELGRVDDIWSLFYMTVEFLEGTLPWKGKEKDKIGDYKQKHTKEKLVRNLPVQMTYYLHYLQGLAYESAPDYDYIRTLYQEMFNATGANENTITYDWDAPLLPTANFSTSTGGMVGGGGDGTMDMSVSLPACAPTAVTTTNPDQSFTPMMIDPCDHHVDILPPLVQMGTAASAAEPENGSLQYQLSPSHQQHQHSTASGTLTLKRSYIHLKKKLVQYSPEEQQHQAHSLQQANMMGKPPQPQHQPLEPRPPAAAPPDHSISKTFSFTRAAGKRLTRSFTLLKNN